MAESSIGDFAKNALIFVGGVAVGYSLKKFVESDSFEEIKSEAIDLINGFTGDNYEDKTEYVNINIDSSDAEDIVEDVPVEKKEYVDVNVTDSDSKNESKEDLNDMEDIVEDVSVEKKEYVDVNVTDSDSKKEFKENNADDDVDITIK